MAYRISMRTTARTAPIEFRDAVEQWARQFGGHGDIVWDDNFRCWVVKLTLKPGDPRLKDPDGSTHFEQTFLHEWVRPEDVKHPLHRKLTRRGKRNELLPSYVGMELDDIGIQGILEMLDRGSLLTGRGEFKSAQHALTVVMGRNRDLSETRRNDARELARDIVKSTRRRRLNIPFLGVGIDLSRNRSTP